MIVREALADAMAWEAWDEEEVSEGHHDAAWLMMPVAVKAVTDEVRKLHRPVIASFTVRSINDLSSDFTSRSYCVVCGDFFTYPCPTVRLLDEMDAAAGVER